MSNLVIAEHDGAEIKPHTLNTIAAAKAAGGDIHVAVIGSGCQAAADAAAKIAGVSKVLLVDSAEYENQMAEAVAPAIVKLADGYSAVFAPANTFGKNVMPRVAALMDIQQLSEVSAVLGDKTFERPIYAGNAIATVKSAEATDIVTVRMTSFEPVEAEGGAASIETVSGTGAQDLSSFVGQSVVSSDRPELTSAKIVISGGRGMQNGENFGMLEKVADKLGAAVGASRAAVDAGFVPNDYQVGQTGKVVAPDLYIAVGISGAIQHLAGMKDSKVIVAINKDDEAPIFQVADYGLVADLFDAVPALEKELG
ncbi:MAG TPA: electron transfer flavoprotein subunit alpha [Rhodospirillaceae bacterium]|nr:electron transfer flavoprotein subunit alpha [Rhodospirillaceae bacterium]MBB58755.1 electron transfer flavoprotein subunit alpha [Rhodospirillaceae bacterium]HAE01495.1 electron transfer flavoprotein subunit alpha [Rhodospirillaceae bacterium]